MDGQRVVFPIKLLPEATIPVGHMDGPPLAAKLAIVIGRQYKLSELVKTNINT